MSEAGGARTLGETAKLIRSKNAGPFQITIDVMFDDEAVYRHVCDGGLLAPARVAARYGVAPEEVETMPYDAALAIKVRLPRRCVSGDFEDADVFGGQLYGPLVELPLDEPAR